MKDLAIIGGGIIGMTLANYIDPTKYKVTLFDHGQGQATQASAGIISPWLSKRRNKQWYQLAKDSAAFFPKLIQDFSLPSSVYQKNGTLILRKPAELEDLMSLAQDRKQMAPEIGELHLLSSEQTSEKLPLLKKTPSLYLSGGGRLDGACYLSFLKKRATSLNVTFQPSKVTLSKKRDDWIVHFDGKESQFDAVALCNGPGLTDILKSLHYSVDIRPQKGQLLVFSTNYVDDSWPVAMLDAESDLIPFGKGKIIVGATHENDGGTDLTPTKIAFSELEKKTVPFLDNQSFFKEFSASYRVGTRAYTSDFAPFFNYLPNESNLVAASGLGSSGLTTGPYIGHLLAQYFNSGQSDWMSYQKPIDHYIRIDHHK